MRPVLLWWDGAPLGSWPVFFALATLAGMALFTLLLQRAQKTASAQLGEVVNGDRPLAASLGRLNPGLFCATVYLCGLVGARLVGAVAGSVGQGDAGILGPMSFFGGLGGGLVGALPFFVAGGRPDPVRLPTLLDAAMPAVALGLAVGRIGCLLNGDDYGLVVGAESPDPAPGAGLMRLLPGAGPGPELRYGTQLEESLFCGLLVTMCLILLWLRPRIFAAGVVGSACGVILCVHRIWNEAFREGPRFLLGTFVFSPWQAVAFVIACLFMLLLVWCLRRGHGQHKLH